MLLFLKGEKSQFLVIGIVLYEQNNSCHPSFGSTPVNRGHAAIAIVGYGFSLVDILGAWVQPKRAGGP